MGALGDGKNAEMGVTQNATPARRLQLCRKQPPSRGAAGHPCISTMEKHLKNQTG